MKTPEAQSENDRELKTVFFQRQIPIAPSLAWTRGILLGALLCTSLLRLEARENKYDVLSRVIAPIVAVFAEQEDGESHALSAGITLLEMTGVSPEYSQARLEIAAQSPDRLLIRGPVNGETVTLCRRGQEVWAAPGSKARAAIGELKNLPKLDPATKLGPMRLPISQQQLIFLPALFSVEDLGDASLSGRDCRVIGVQLMSELARAGAGLGEWYGKIWVDAEFKPVQFELSKPGWKALVGFDRVAYPPSLPPEKWRPAPVEAGDVLLLSAPQFRQLFDAALLELQRAGAGQKRAGDRPPSTR